MSYLSVWCTPSRGFCMQNGRGKLAILIRQVFDLLVVTACFFLADHESSRRIGTLSLCNLLSMQIRIKDLLILALFLFSWRSLFSMFGLYRSRRIWSRLASKMLDVFKASFAGSLILIALGRASVLSQLTPRFALSFWAISTFGAMSTRLAVRNLLNTLRLRGQNLHHF